VRKEKGKRKKKENHQPRRWAKEIREKDRNEGERSEEYTD